MPCGQQLVVGADANQRALSGDEKAAVLLLALGPDFGKPILEELDEMEIRSLSRAMVRLGADHPGDARRAARRVRHLDLLQRHHLGQLRHHQRLLLSFLPARARRRHHGRDPRTGRPQHVGEAEQRSGGRARQLPQERIPADHRRGAVSKIATDHASKVLAVLPEELAMDVVQRMLGARPGAEGNPRKDRDDAPHRVHVDAQPHQAPRQPRADGRDLQLLRSPDRSALHHLARGARTARPPSASRR